MEQEKRVLIAFVLSVAMLMVWRIFFVKMPPPPPKTSAPVSQKAAPAPSGSPQTPGQSPSPNQAAPRPAAVTLPVEQGTSAQDLVIEDEFYRVTLSTQGGLVKSWVLKKYLDEQDKPLDVVNSEACKTLGFPMSLNVLAGSAGQPDQTLSDRLNSALYVASPSGTTLQAPVKVVLTNSDGKMRARKEFSFGKGYEVDAEVSVFDGQNYEPLEVKWPGGFGDQSLPFKVREALSQAVYGTPDHLTKVAESKVKEPRAIPGPLVAGLEDRFFVDVFLPDSPEADLFRVERRTWTPANWTEKEPPGALEAALGSAEGKPLAFRLLVAPKDLDVLRAVKPPLDGLVDYGWFSFIAKPLFLALRYVYDHWIHNWGWAIVILTVLLNLALFPLKMKSIRSAQEMQRVAPLVKSIQDKYKQYKFNDPRKQRMNEEVMKLYKEHHINPLGGCVPMVLQLPLLYGFYELLETAIELRHAPWVLWIKDLASPDNFHLFGYPLPLLPIVMIVTMFVLQLMTPMATVDPSQKRMMMVTPLVFGIIFFRLASGLNLYYLTANIVGIGQQMLINRMIPKQAPAPPPSGRSKPPVRSAVTVNK
ncbi:MAG TPA: membrane protein insertase YidC [Terriglobia bacterium]|nr:membrane protein insertase YidC [Terriglobia bacterium]